MEKLTLEQVKNKKALLELQLLNDIEEFEKATGLFVDEILVNRMEVFVQGKKEKRHYDLELKVDIKL